MTHTLNCWQFKNCGREIGGLFADTLGVCPAAASFKHDGLHDGQAAGRACWLVAGSGCKAASTPLCLTPRCDQCDFYRRVQFEESHPHIEVAVPVLR